MTKSFPVSTIHGVGGPGVTEGDRDIVNSSDDINRLNIIEQRSVFVSSWLLGRRDEISPFSVNASLVFECVV